MFGTTGPHEVLLSPELENGAMADGGRLLGTPTKTCSKKGSL